jgi:hypothetical protein
MLLYVLVMVFGILGCPSNDPTTPLKTSSTVSSSPTPTQHDVNTSHDDTANLPVSKPSTILLLGSGLVGLGGLGRKWFKK